jgi:hypothetical protein
VRSARGKGTTRMNTDEPTKKIEELRKLAAQAQIVAETTLDPNRKRALNAIALKYKRLAEFVRVKP